MFYAWTYSLSGYLVAGLLLGPSFFNFVSPADIQSFNLVNEIALAAIAFSIGNEFVLKEIKKIGKSIFIITLLEVVGAFVEEVLDERSGSLAGLFGDHA